MNKRLLILLMLAVVCVGVLVRYRLRQTAPEAATQSTNARSTGASAFLRPPGTGGPAKQIVAQPEPPAVVAPHTNLFARMLAGEETPPLTLEQVAPYLEANHRSAESLIAGYLVAGHEKALLEEAKQKFPNDPHVAYFAAVQAGSPEDRQQWLAAFKQAAPDNPLPNYLSALDHFKGQQTTAAMQDLAAAAAQPNYQDYSADFLQSDAEAYRAAGMSEVDAKAMAASQLILPQLVQLKQLGVSLSDLAKSSLQSGDAASAQAAVQAGMALGQRLEQQGAGNVLISDLVGIAVEKLALGAMDPTVPYGDSGQTVQNQLDQATDRRNGIKALSSQFQSVLPTVSEPDLVNYFDRQKAYGEIAAEQWVLGKYGAK